VIQTTQIRERRGEKKIAAHKKKEKNLLCEEMEKIQTCRKRIFSIDPSSITTEVVDSSAAKTRARFVSSEFVKSYSNYKNTGITGNLHNKMASNNTHLPNTMRIDVNNNSPVRSLARATAAYIPSPTVCGSSPSSASKSAKNDLESWNNASPRSDHGGSPCSEYEYIEHVPYLPLETPNTVVTQTISSETLIHVLQGKYSDLYDSIRIIDCRFPFEYNGGHIRGAENLYTWEQISATLFPTNDASIQAHTTKSRQLIVLHCEFSQKRGPSWWGRVRSHDRETRPAAETNLNQFIYPEMYVLKNGYKDFYEAAGAQLSQQHVDIRETGDDGQCKRQKTDSVASHTPHKTPKNASSDLFENEEPSYMKMSSPEHQTECSALLKRFQDETNPKRRARNASLARALFAR